MGTFNDPWITVVHTVSFGWGMASDVVVTASAGGLKSESVATLKKPVS